MKPLQHILESLLDADFDITDNVLTLTQAGWYIEKAEASEYMMTPVNKKRISELTGLKCSVISGDAPWVAFEEIGNETRIKCSSRDRWGSHRFIFAHWLLALMKTARGDEKSINTTIHDMMSSVAQNDFVPMKVTKRGGKLFIKGEWIYKSPLYKGKKAKLSITLSQRAPENRVRFYK